MTDLMTESIESRPVRAARSRSAVQRWAMAAGVAAGLLALAACTSPSVRLDPLPPVENRAPGGASAAGQTPAQALPTAQSKVATVDLGKQGGAGGTVNGLNPLGAAGGMDAASLKALETRVIYFDYDSNVVKPEYQPVISAQARRLNNERQRKLLLEGHTDERGGREYNLALGQRRAEAVSRALALLGVSDGQVEAVSYGMERPAVQGSDEAAWAKNRRVEIKDR
ncbi:MAG: hypothetical protein RL722_505 [Pseudomonadota bacterium]